MTEYDRAKAIAHDRVEILGVPFDRLTLEGAVERVLALAKSERMSLVLTPNPEIVERALRDAEMMQILKSADLCLADGTGIVWASRLLGKPVPERVTGIDVFLRLLSRSAEEGWTLYLLGGRPEVIPLAVEKAETQYGARIVGSHHGYFTDGEAAAVLEDIRRCRPQILITGMGAPRDQKWPYAHRNELGGCVCIGVGGSFDVLAGRMRRAPSWIRKLQLEWLYRLARQPSRWRRQLDLPRFVLHVLLAARGVRKQHPRDM